MTARLNRGSDTTVIRHSKQAAEVTSAAATEFRPPRALLYPLGAREIPRPLSPNSRPSPSGDWRAGRAWRLIPDGHDPLVTAEARRTVHVLLDLVPNGLHGSAGRAHLRL